MTARLALFFAFLLVLAPAEAAKIEAVDALPGVPVWLSEDHTVPVVAVSASLAAGAIYDPTGKSGLAALAGALLDQGAGNLNADAFQAALALRGIKLTVAPSADTLTIRVLVQPVHVKEAFRLLSLALTKPRFDADAVTRLRLALMRDYDNGRSDPARVAEIGFYSLYFGPYPYSRPVGGNPHGLAAISQQDLRSFVRTHWVQTGLKLAVSGDISGDTLAPLVKAAFDVLPVAAPPQPVVPYSKGAPGQHSLPMEVARPVVVFGAPGPKRSDRDFLAATIANDILGGAGPSSRLVRDLSERRGRPSDIVTAMTVFDRAGLLTGSVSAHKANVRQTISQMREIMRKFAADGPTDREVAEAKARFTASYPLLFTSNEDTARQLNLIQQQGLPFDYVDKRAAMIASVSTADVRRAAQRLFNPDRLTIVVAGSLREGNTEPADSP